MSDSGYTGGQLALAFLAGAAAGAAVALLVAPQSGAETRAQIRRMAATSRDKAARLPEALKGAVGAAQEAFNDALS